MEFLRDNLPSWIADATASIPGYAFVSQIILKAFGIDVGDAVSFYLVLFGLYQGAMLLYNKVHEYFL
jgi:chaperone BCS1